jgi:hypothetical protein
MPFRPGYLYVRPHIEQRCQLNRCPRSAAIAPGALWSRRGSSWSQPSHTPRRGRSAYPKASPSGATRRPRSAATRAVSRSVVVGTSRQRAAPRSQFVSAPPALRLLRLALAVQAALWATARASPPPRCLPPQPWQRPCTGSNSSIASAAWRGLTCRSTGASTAWHLGRDPLSVHVAPRGPGAMPFRPGYLYVRLHN